MLKFCVFAIVKVMRRYLLRRMRLWQILPLLVFGLLLCGGIVEAGIAISDAIAVLVERRNQ